MNKPGKSPKEKLASEWVAKALRLFQASSSEEALAMKAYMKNRFEFFGIKKPVRAELMKILYASEGIPGNDIFREVACLLWDNPNRESHYLAMDVLFRNRKNFIGDDIYLLEEFMRSNSWWDSIDFISPKLASHWFKLFPSRKEEILFKWNTDGDFWLRRASLIAQLHGKQDVDLDLQFRLIIPLLKEKEFFIRKAIGWSLREIAKTHPEPVLAFTDQHEMSGLSRREALKHFPDKR
ncbi:MAG: DNA alkylation repair protein [Bacteroidetes bacterium]|nr:DNA alkylation repair protein [Bacteroidota bacterium]